ncbi:MAG: (2Fe-2S)-binding protein [Fuerstiella sp.]|nr:(2Fe-2S)-binding protein [Fuerstiella sp.]
MNHVRIHRPGVASQLSECGGAGTGCGWCVPFLRQHFEASQRDATPDISVSEEESAARRQQYLAEKRESRRRRSPD